MSTQTTTRTSGAVGSFGMGRTGFGGSARLQSVFEAAEISQRHRGVYGWGQVGSRLYGKGYPWTPFQRSPVTGAAAAVLTLTSSSGALLGRIRTDIQKSILKSFRGTIDERGNAGFEMVLNSLPDFRLPSMSIITLAVAGGSPLNWFQGRILRVPDQGTARVEYKYTGFGVRKSLSSDTVGEGTFPAQTDVGVIVFQIVRDIIAPFTQIKFNAGKIQTSTGVFTAETQFVQETDLARLLTGYAKMAGARWYVDGDGEFVFEVRTDALVRNWIIGYDVMQFEPDLNEDAVKNRITVSRKFANGTAGWEIGFIANGEESQAKYDVQALPFQLGGIYSDDDCEIVARALLEDLEEPKYYGRARNIPIKSGADFIQQGTHRFIDQPSRFNLDANNCDDDTEWTLVNPGGNDLAKITDTQLFTDGLGSLKLSWSDADGSTVRVPVTVVGKIKKIKLFFYGSRTGTLLRFGLGNGDFTQNQRDIAIPIRDTWLDFEWNITDLDLEDVNEIGFTVLDSTASSIVRIDAIIFEMVGSRHYRMEFSGGTFVFTPERAVWETVEFGPPPSRSYDYAAEAIARSEENRIASQV